MLDSGRRDDEHAGGRSRGGPSGDEARPCRGAQGQGHRYRIRVAHRARRRYEELNRVDLAEGLRRQAEVLRSYVC